MIWGPSRGPLDEDAVRDAYPWPPDRRWVRAMMVTSLDGAAAGPDGLSGSISSDADRLVFDSTRRLADAVLVGAGTVRKEQYGAMVAKPRDADARRAAGLQPAPRLVVVSGSLQLPWDWPVFTDSALPPLVVTAVSEDHPGLAVAEHARCEVMNLPGGEVTPEPLLDALEAMGLLRIVCEGGPTLLASIVAAGLLDEADITVSPLFAGGGQSPTTAGLPDVARLELVHVITADDHLMARYVARGRA